MRILVFTRYTARPALGASCAPALAVLMRSTGGIRNREEAHTFPRSMPGAAFRGL